MSWKTLFVGDVHATPEELDDVTKLFKMILQVAQAEKVDEICFLGDSYHTHQVIRAEVMHFYRTWFGYLRQCGFRVHALVGNHDYAGEGNSIHAMEIHEDQIQVISGSMTFGNRTYMPYYADREKFVHDANEYGGEILICHQTFSGASYENGFKAEDGVDPDLLNYKTILSGHIHAPQSFGKVTYIGAPRWRILTDANTERAIWMYTFSGDGKVESTKSFDTGTVCRKIFHHVQRPNGDLLPKYLNPKDDWRIDIYGPQTFIDQREGVLRAWGVKVRTFCTDRPTSKVSEAEGVGTAFRKFLDGFTVRHGTPKDELLNMAQTRLHV